jgi:hypothetical protein
MKDLVDEREEALEHQNAAALRDAREEVYTENHVGSSSVLQCNDIESMFSSILQISSS